MDKINTLHCKYYLKIGKTSVYCDHAPLIIFHLLYIIALKIHGIKISSRTMFKVLCQ